MTKARFILLSLLLASQLVSFIVYGQAGQAALPCDIPSSITITTNAPTDEICGSTQWSFDVDYTEGDFYQWEIIRPAMGSVVVGKHSPHVEVMFHNPADHYKKVRVGVIVAITKCNYTLRDTLVMYVMDTPQYSASASDTFIYAEEEVGFNISPTPKDYDQLIWHFGDGHTSNVANATHFFPKNNSTVEYFPKVSIYSPEGCPGKVSVSTGSVKVVPEPLPKAASVVNMGSCYLGYTASCGIDSFYDVSLFHHSNLSPPELRQVKHSYAYRTDGNAWQTISAPDSAVTASVQLPAGEYQFREIIETKDPSSTSCTATLDIKLPEKPDAAFEIESQYLPACVLEGVIQFDNKSMPSEGLSYVWNFGDATVNYLPNPAKVFGNKDFVGMVYTVMLIASNDLGCIDSTYSHIEIEDNIYWDGKIKPSLFVNPDLPQPEGTPITLTYLSMTGGNPSTFVWYEGNKPISPEVHDPSFEVNKPGMYWVLGKDNYGCLVPSYQVPITFTDKP